MNRTSRQSSGLGRALYASLAGNMVLTRQLRKPMACVLLAITTVLQSGVPAAAQITPCLLPPRSIKTGNGPVSMLATDLNSDGKTDLVTTNRLDHNLSILLNTGRGFAPSISVGSGLGPVAIAAADLNADGAPDLVTANFDSDNLSVLLGHGDGSFRQDIRYLAGREPSDVAVANFNGDHIPDLAVSCRNDDTISIRLGTGNGEFGEPIAAPTGERPTALIAADVNADGNVDLLTANYDSNDVTLLIGEGNGRFHAGRPYRTGLGPAAIAVLDLNRDGALDAVVSCATLTEGSLSILLGNTKGGFNAATTLETGDPLGNVFVADATGDSIPDLIFGRSNFESSHVAILPLSADGTAGTPLTFPAGNLPLSVVLADFNLDGIPDLATGNYFGDDISLLLGRDCQSVGDGDGISLDEVAALLSNQFSLGDQNRDGYLDFTEASLLVFELSVPEFDQLDTDNDGRLNELEISGSSNGYGCLPTVRSWRRRLSTLFLLGTTGTSPIVPHF